MTDRGNRGTMNKEVQHSKSQAIALSRLGEDQHNLHASADRLNDAQVELFTRMRDQGAKICVTGLPGKAQDDPTTLEAFKTAKMAQGREINRSPQFHKMPFASRNTMLRSLDGGHFEFVSTHSDSIHHFYGLSERALALLTKHQTAKRQSALRSTTPAA